MRKAQIFIPFVLFSIVFGLSTCYFKEFTDAELRSKWYWLYISIALCCIVSLLFKFKESHCIKKVIYWLLPLFTICVINVPVNFFGMFLGVYCSSFFLVCYLSIFIIQSHAFETLSASISVSALLLSLYGIAQHCKILPSSNDPFIGVGNFDNPAGYASVLAFSLPFVLYHVVSDKKTIQYIAQIICIIILVAIALTSSRTAILAVILMGLLYSFRQYKDLFINLPLWSRIIGSGSIVVLILIGLYFAKPDSANGRLLVWRCTWDMICEKPLLGHGYKSFEANYMLYQAHYFEQNPNSELLMLADNVKQPFNEFLRLTAEFGLIALLVLLWLTWQLIRTFLKNKNRQSFTFISVLLLVTIFSCFSYPFSYPFTWFIVAFCIGGLSTFTNQDKNKSKQISYLKFPIASLSIWLLSFTIFDMYFNRQWNQIIHTIYSGHNIRTPATQYDRLYPFFKDDANFVYNYAVVLNLAGNYTESLQQTIQCEKRLNDYDIQILKAENYKKMDSLLQAKECYQLAANMCPNRFIPLYELVNLYDRLHQPIKAMKLANDIISKPEKVPSGMVTAIKMKMQERIKLSSEY